MAHKALTKTGDCRASFTTFSPKSFLVVVVIFSFVQQYFSLWLMYLVYHTERVFNERPDRPQTKTTPQLPPPAQQLFGHSVPPRPPETGKQAYSAQDLQKADTPWSLQPDPEPGSPYLAIRKGVRDPAQHQPLSFCARADLQPDGLGACAKQTCVCLQNTLWMWPESQFIHRNQSSAANTSVRQTIEPLILWERNHQLLVEFSISNVWCAASIVQMHT